MFFVEMCFHHQGVAHNASELDQRVSLGMQERGCRGVKGATGFNTVAPY